MWMESQNYQREIESQRAERTACHELECGTIHCMALNKQNCRISRKKENHPAGLRNMDRSLRRLTAMSRDEQRYRCSEQQSQQKLDL